MNNYVEQPDAEVIPVKKYQQLVELKGKEIINQVPDLVQEELKKAKMLTEKEAYRFKVPFNQNYNINPDRKPNSDASFGILRRMAVLYPIARACINYRITQVTQLEWDIILKDDINGTEEQYQGQINKAKAFFRYPFGDKTRMRQMLTMMVDDFLTIDAVCFEMQHTRGGEFLRLIPVDPATIVLKLNDDGSTPMPPETAYVQYIDGKKINEFTTDEIIYEFMGARSFSAYGLAPLESLLMQAESALRGTLYNLHYMRE